MRVGTVAEGLRDEAGTEGMPAELGDGVGAVSSSSSAAADRRVRVALPEEGENVLAALVEEGRAPEGEERGPAPG